MIPPKVVAEIPGTGWRTSALALNASCARRVAVTVYPELQDDTDSRQMQAARSHALSLPAMLDAARIAELLQPFVADFSPGCGVSPELASQLQTYLDLLLRWNARINLTAVREPEQIVTRHFGESLFAARVLRDFGAFAAPATTLADLGSGAGFPGIPIKLFVPDLHLTLIESQNKKATFLREVVRALGLSHIVVHCGRAETWGQTAHVVTVRAVEKFASSLPVAVRLVEPGGTLALLIGESQRQAAASALGIGWEREASERIPGSGGRIVWLARRRTDEPKS